MALTSSAVAALVAFVALTPSAAAITLPEAQSAYRSNRVAEAERMLTEIAADGEAAATDRAEAHRMLARIDWMARGETDAAARALAEIPAGEGRCAVMVAVLSVYREAGQPGAVLDQAEAAGRTCRASDGEALHIERARAHLALAGAAPDEDRSRQLDLAAAQLGAIDPLAHVTPDVAAPRFSLALAQRDSAAALDAWQTYYWLTDADAPQALSQYSGRVGQIFTAGLAPNAADGDIVALLAMLTRAGFVDDARLIAAQTGIAARASADPEWRRVDTYFTLHRAIRDATLRANREIINGGAASWHRDAIIAATMQAMQSVGASGDPQVVMPEVFGAYGTVGETGGYPSMHAGHLVQDERLNVEQYGRTGEVRFIVIDNMLANGYESWLWDGWAEAGGWSSDGNVIVQVRSAYTGSPVRILRRARPGPERERYLADIARDDGAERSALGRDGVGELPSTSARLEMQVYDAMATRYGGDDHAFIAELWRAINQYSIESHEGRHALDNANEPGLSAAELEFRAKLSQIIFADYPRLGLASVAGQPINDTPHGRGNRRVLEGYRNWMRAHGRDIPGFDRTQPALTQLTLLSDAQIVAIARSLDPWAR